jgi:hypothetical protein
MSSGHAVPFYCPYCGEEDLVPDLPAASADAGKGAGSGEGHGRWACRSCLRAFRLSLTAIAVPAAPAPGTSPPQAPTT